MASLDSIFNRSDPSTPGHYGPSQKALLILDFHQFIINIAGPEAQKATQNAVQLRQWALSQGIAVVHGLIDVDGKPPATYKNGPMLTRVAATAKANREHEEPEELRAVNSELEVTFTRAPGHISALESPGLIEFLEQNNIKSLIICGLSASGCVLRTACAANEAKKVVTVISDGCADPGEGVHELLLGKVLPMSAHVTTAAEFQEGFALTQSKA